MRTGTDQPDGWPAAERIEAVTRGVARANRDHQAAADACVARRGRRGFALEDQLGGRPPVRIIWSRRRKRRMDACGSSSFPRALVDGIAATRRASRGSSRSPSSRGRPPDGAGAQAVRAAGIRPLRRRQRVSGRCTALRRRVTRRDRTCVGPGASRGDLTSQCPRRCVRRRCRAVALATRDWDGIPARHAVALGERRGGRICVDTESHWRCANVDPGGAAAALQAAVCAGADARRRRRRDPRRGKRRRVGVAAIRCVA